MAIHNFHTGPPDALAPVGSESESEFHWNAQSILGTATIFTDLGTAARAASVVYDGPALGHTEAGTHLGTSVTSASQTYPQPAIRPV